MVVQLQDGCYNFLLIKNERDLGSRFLPAATAGPIGYPLFFVPLRHMHVIRLVTAAFVEAVLIPSTQKHRLVLRLGRSIYLAQSTRFHPHRDTLCCIRIHKISIQTAHCLTILASF